MVSCLLFVVAFSAFSYLLFDSSISFLDRIKILRCSILFQRCRVIISYVTFVLLYIFTTFLTYRLQKLSRLQHKHQQTVLFTAVRKVLIHLSASHPAIQLFAGIEAYPCYPWVLVRFKDFGISAKQGLNYTFIRYRSTYSILIEYSKQ